MGNRQTSDWTDTSEGAFGRPGAIGDRGELVVFQILKDAGLNVSHNPNNRAKQLIGHDLVVENDQGIDVKTNLYSNRDVCVDAEKIWTSKATFWFHLNDKNHNDYIMYQVFNMQKYLRENNIPISITKAGPVYWVPRSVNEL